MKTAADRQMTIGFAAALLLSLPPEVCALRASDVLDRCGVTQGLCVDLSSSGTLAADLTESQEMLVHSLSLTDSTAEVTRRAIFYKRTYGLASAEAALTWSSLPYPDNFVNLLVTDNLQLLLSRGLALREILRVLAPYGAAFIGQRGLTGAELSAVSLRSMLREAGVADPQLVVTQEGTYALFRKALTPGMGEWTHKHGGPEGNALSTDMLVSPPTHVKWTSGSDFIKSMSGTWPGIRLAGGKAVYINPRFDVVSSDIFARDAFSGALLWSRTDLIKVRMGWIPLVFTGDRIYTAVGTSGPVVCLDAANGKTLKSYDNITWERFRSQNEKMHELSVALCNGTLLVGAGSRLHALKPETGEHIWMFDPGTTKRVYWVSASQEKKSVYAVVSDSSIWPDWELNTRWPMVKRGGDIMAFDLATGQRRWVNRDFHGKCLGQLVYNNGKLGVFGHGWPGKGTPPQVPVIAMLDPDNGKTVWADTFKVADYSLSPWEYYYMYMRGDKAYVGQHRHLRIYDINTGNFKLWQYQGIKAGENQRCSRGVATPRYLWFGYGTWIDTAFNYELKPLRRSGCATSGFPGYGMFMHTPATCGCIPELDGGKGFVALSTEGSRRVVADAWRLVPGTTSWRGSGGPTGMSVLSTHVLRKAAGSSALDRSSPIVGDWPESRHRGLQKLASRADFSVDGYGFLSHGSRLQLDVSRPDGSSFTLITGGRVDLEPVIYGRRAYIGCRDGMLYCCDLERGALLSRFLAAPYDLRMMSASQLESHWPITSVGIVDGVLRVSAGRHPGLEGGIFTYNIDPETGVVLSKERTFLPADGELSRPEKGFEISEQIPPGEVPHFEQHRSGPQEPAPRTDVEPDMRMRAGKVTIDFGPGGPVDAALSVLDMKGRTLVYHRGRFTGALTLPLGELKPGRYVISCECGGKALTRTIGIHRPGR